MMQISRILTSTCLLLGCTVALIPTNTLAQSVGGGDQRDPFNRASNGDASGLMQLINQSQLNGKNNDPNYANTQREQLNSATEDFRLRQLQSLRQQRDRKNTPVKPTKP
jgi:hypothetical protein